MQSIGTKIGIGAIALLCLGAGTVAIARTERTPNAIVQNLNRPVLQLGDRREEVSQVQALLQLLGFYTGPVNGNFDRATADAVSDFQRAAGLPPSGMVDGPTWNRLLPDPTASPTPETPVCECPPVSCPRPTCPPPRVVTSGTSGGDFPILRRGSQGSAVRGVQQRLQALGVYSGGVTGTFGTATETAVREMQQRSGLQVDGVVGPNTWNALMR